MKAHMANADLQSKHQIDSQSTMQTFTVTAEGIQMQKGIIVTRANLLDHYAVGLYTAVTR